MSALDRNHGQYGQVHADPAGGAALVQLVSMDNWDLDMARDRARSTCFEDPNHTYNQGKPDIKGSFKGQYDKSASGLLLFSMAAGIVAPTLRLIPDRNFAAQFFGGAGWLDAKIACDVNGNVTVAGTFVAAAAWTTPVNPA